MSNNDQKKSYGIAKILKMAISLTVICICVSLAVSVSYSLTKDKIEERRIEAEKAAIIKVFEAESISYRPLENAPDNVGNVFEVKDGDILLGWAISVSPSGFGGNIDMIVGIKSDGVIKGVDITALSETPGLGSRVAEPSYLTKYHGLFAGKSLKLKDDIDAVSGATISSRSVLNGVNDAISAIAGMGLIAPID